MEPVNPAVVNQQVLIPGRAAVVNKIKRRIAHVGAKEVAEWSGARKTICPGRALYMIGSCGDLLRLVTIIGLHKCFPLRFLNRIY